MNTKFEYMYRDASNYKQFESVVFPGEITDKERDIIQNSLEDGENFIPFQVGLDDLQPRMVSYPSADDHVWHEIESITLVEDKPTQSIDIHMFVEKFKGIEWDVVEAAKRHSIQ